MEERRQVFLDASVRNPYFKYSLGTTITLLVLAMLYSKQWIDHRRTMWITAEMMTDLYNHDLYSRDVAEKAIQKYNQHIERCNRAIEAAQHGSTLPAATRIYSMPSCKRPQANLTWQTPRTPLSRNS